MDYVIRTHIWKEVFRLHIPDINFVLEKTSKLYNLETNNVYEKKLSDYTIRKLITNLEKIKNITYGHF